MKKNSEPATRLTLITQRAKTIQRGAAQEEASALPVHAWNLAQTRRSDGDQVRATSIARLPLSPGDDGSSARKSTIGLSSSGVELASAVKRQRRNGQRPVLQESYAERLKRCGETGSTAS